MRERHVLQCGEGTEPQGTLRFGMRRRAAGPYTAKSARRERRMLAVLGEADIGNAGVAIGGGSSQAIAAFVFGVASMAFDPHEPHVMRLLGGEEALP